jgi:hypothetical protein
MDQFMEPGLEWQFGNRRHGDAALAGKTLGIPIQIIEWDLGDVEPGEGERLVPMGNHQRFEILSGCLSQHKPVRAVDKPCKCRALGVIVGDNRLILALALDRHRHTQNDGLRSLHDMAPLGLPANERRDGARSDAALGTLDHRQELVSEGIAIECCVCLRDDARPGDRSLEQVCKRCVGKGQCSLLKGGLAG